jgi:hypothetical protein
VHLVHELGVVIVPRIEANENERRETKVEQVKMRDQSVILRD